MKTWPIDDHNQGIFSHKLGHFFPIFQKGQGRPPPSPSLVTRLCKMWTSIKMCSAREFDHLKKNILVNVNFSELSRKELPHESSNHIQNWAAIPIFSFLYFFRIIFNISFGSPYLVSVQIILQTSYGSLNLLLLLTYNLLQYRVSFSACLLWKLMQSWGNVVHYRQI